MKEGKETKKHWNVLERITRVKGNWMDYNYDKVLLPDGKTIDYEAINYHHAGVGAVAENDKGEIILVKNYRYISDFTGWEVPAGTIPENQHPSDCIIQELKEEAGCEVSLESLYYLGNFYPSIGSSNQFFHGYHVKNVKQDFSHTDTNEIIETKWFTKEEIKKMIKTGEIKDGFSLYLLMRILLESKQ